MIRLRARDLLLASALLVGVAATAAGTTADLGSLFPDEAEILTEGEGIHRLDLPVEVLTACRPDLSDLRVFDGEGKEVPYLVDSGLGPDEELHVKETLPAPILDVKREVVERGGRPDLRRQAFELAVPPSESPDGRWELVVDVRRGRWVRRVDLLVIGEDEALAPLLRGASLFRLPGADRASKNRLELPPVDGARIRVVFEGEDGAFLEPAFRFERTTVRERRRWVSVPLETIAVMQRDGRTLVDLARPAGIVPDILSLETSTGLFDRLVTIRDEGPGIGQEILGRDRLLRVESLVPVEQLEVRVRPARGDWLQVEIVDGDSPPLEGVSFTARVRLPSLLFHLPKTAGGGLLRFGGGRAFRPRYDLPTLLPPAAGRRGEPRVEATANLLDRDAALRARLGAIRPNPRFDPAPALEFAMRPGAEIDVRPYSHERRLQVPASPEGLVRLRLDPADVAVLRPDHADIRVVDPEGRQWPYLLQRDGARELMPLGVTRAQEEEGVSRYDLALPASPVRLDQVIVDTETPFFDRDYTLIGETPDGAEREIARGRLTRKIGRFGPVSVAFEPIRVESLHLEVIDGDDAPLELDAARGRLLLPELFLAAPEGEYAVLLGEPDARAPRYELERVRGVVLGVQSATATAAELRPNPEDSLSARVSRGKTGQRALLWVVLVGAVAILGFITLRLARREPSSEG